MSADMKTALMTAEQVADFLRIPADDVLGMVADGELPAMAADGDDVLIAEGALREFLHDAWTGDPWL